MFRTILFIVFSSIVLLICSIYLATDGEAFGASCAPAGTATRMALSQPPERA